MSLGVSRSLKLPHTLGHTSDCNQKGYNLPSAERSFKLANPLSILKSWRIRLAPKRAISYREAGGHEREGTGQCDGLSKT